MKTTSTKQKKNVKLPNIWDEAAGLLAETEKKNLQELRKNRQDWEKRMKKLSSL